MMYVCHVVLSEDEYVYLWFRYMRELENVKRMEEEMMKKYYKSKRWRV
jgi:hypothetical protein